VCACSFSVDDGTSTVFVSCVDSLVSTLLDLNLTQWKDLQELVQPLGCVSYELVCLLVDDDFKPVSG